MAKDNEKMSALQVAILGGIHLDQNEALALIKSGFFAEKKTTSKKITKNENIKKTTHKKRSG